MCCLSVCWLTLSLSSDTFAGSGVEVPPWVQVDPSRGDLILPNLDSASCVKLAELRDAVKNEGLLAYYVAMSITDIGTE